MKVSELRNHQNKRISFMSDIFVLIKLKSWLFLKLWSDISVNEITTSVIITWQWNSSANSMCSLMSYFSRWESITQKLIMKPLLISDSVFYNVKFGRPLLRVENFVKMLIDSLCKKSSCQVSFRLNTWEEKFWEQQQWIEQTM